jgi:hypothetical protein
VRWHTERVDIVCLAELLELKRVVALMAIKDKQPTCTNNPIVRVGNKVLQPRYSNLICCPPIVTDCDGLIRWDIVFLIPLR